MKAYGSHRSTEYLNDRYKIGLELSNRELIVDY